VSAFECQESFPLYFIHYLSSFIDRNKEELRKSDFSQILQEKNILDDPWEGKGLVLKNEKKSKGIGFPTVEEAQNLWSDGIIMSGEELKKFLPKIYVHFPPFHLENPRAHVSTEYRVPFILWIGEIRIDYQNCPYELPSPVPELAMVDSGSDQFSIPYDVLFAIARNHISCSRPVYLKLESGDLEIVALYLDAEVEIPGVIRHRVSVFGEINRTSEDRPEWLVGRQGLINNIVTTIVGTNVINYTKQPGVHMDYVEFNDTDEDFTVPKKQKRQKKFVFKKKKKQNTESPIRIALGKKIVFLQIACRLVLLRFQFRTIGYTMTQTVTIRTTRLVANIE